MKDLGNKVHAFGKALMMPISVIAAAGIFLGLAAAMQNPAITGDAFAEMKTPQLIIGFIRQIAGALFANLPLFLPSPAPSAWRTPKADGGVRRGDWLYFHARRGQGDADRAKFDARHHRRRRAYRGGDGSYRRADVRRRIHPNAGDLHL